MEPLKLLLVAFRKEWLHSLSQSLFTAGYKFETCQASTKKQALLACYQAKYDILITNDQLPDGPIQDLTQVLGNTVACLVISAPPTPSLLSRLARRIPKNRTGA
jgi:DNA-binding response OmpR family regulator